MNAVVNAKYMQKIYIKCQLYADYLTSYSGCTEKNDEKKKRSIKVKYFLFNYIH